MPELTVLDLLIGFGKHSIFIAYSITLWLLEFAFELNNVQLFEYFSKPGMN